MNISEIRDGLEVSPFVVSAWRAQEEWVVDWLHVADGEEVHVARATFREMDNGLEWTRFNVEQEWRGNGLYSKALAFSSGHGGAIIAANTAARDFYLEAGFKEKDGRLVQDKKRSAGWLKGRPSE